MGPTGAEDEATAGCESPVEVAVARVPVESRVEEDVSDSDVSDVPDSSVVRAVLERELRVVVGALAPNELK
jgi:predicted amino acid racemase